MSSLTSSLWFRVWQRWGWTLLTGVFGVVCLVAGWKASVGTHSRVRMAFLLLSVSFFLYVFFQYFFAMAAFSAAHRDAEIKRMKKPPPRTSLIVLYFAFGVIATVSLMALWWWRVS